jgi:hypothetical protein
MAKRTQAEHREILNAAIRQSRQYQNRFPGSEVIFVLAKSATHLTWGEHLEGLFSDGHEDDDVAGILGHVNFAQVQSELFGGPRILTDEEAECALAAALEGNFPEKKPEKTSA